MAKLIIKDLYVSVKGTSILRGLNFEMDEGETVALLGPNGHGKSTLIATIMGDPKYSVDGGSITFDGQDVLAMSPDKRSQLGLFLGMQYPAEIPGLNSADFYKAAMNSHREKPMALSSSTVSLRKPTKRSASHSR
ncbi:MAG: ATP-binding cassette domain-containing protein [Bacilli bacterium]|nr:ATP-binding cassette domain-containing protein [Bacilli bacterium]